MKFFSYEKFSDADGELAKESYFAAKKILNFTHVAVVMLDVAHAQQHDKVIHTIRGDLTKQSAVQTLFRRELQLASAVLNEKRVLILVLNKMDTIDAAQQRLVEKEVVQQVRAHALNVGGTLLCVVC